MEFEIGYTPAEEDPTSVFLDLEEFRIGTQEAEQAIRDTGFEEVVVTN